MSVICRIFRRVSIHSSKAMSSKSSFLNVLMTDVRPASIQQKMMSFYTIIERCLNDGRCVNVIVALGRKDKTKAKLIYFDCLAAYLRLEGFNLVFVKPAPWRAGRLSALIYVATYFARLRGDFTHRLNLACLFAVSRVRMNTFQDIYDALPCSNWLGLTGGLELPALASRRDTVGAESIINALQFGQASMEQQHFSGYKVDNLFVYDNLSEKVFRQLGMRVSNILVTGSPEFEYNLSLVCNEKLLEEERLSVVFIDQPVQQRGEYSEKYLLACRAMLQALNDDREINIKVKPHPRGSAFETAPLTSLSVVEDWSDCLSKAHVAIGFFSNLCDLALKAGRITFYIGSEAVLGKEKCDWITGQGGFVINNIDLVQQEVLRLKRLHVKLANQIAFSATSPSRSPSESIYKKMVECSETQTVA